MNVASEKAMVSILLPAVAPLVGDRVTWDDLELDIVRPAVTLRTISSDQPARDMTSRGGARRSMVEISAHADTNGGASSLLDSIIDALEFAERGPFEIQVDSGPVRFGSVILESVQQSPGPRERSYRKSALFIVWLYD